MKGQKQKVALVFGTLPTIEEIDQFQLIGDQVDLSVISSESVCGFIMKSSRFQNLRCLALPDHDENATYLPGLEKALTGYDQVIIKERTGLYAFQAVKAKSRHKFKLTTWVDNLTPFPAEDVDQIKTIREEVNAATDMFFVQTVAAKNTLLVEGVEEARISVVAPWVNSQVDRTAANRAKALEKLGLPESAVVIAHIGQIEWEEGLLDLINGLKLARGEDSETERRVRLVFCGIGEFGPDLRNALLNLNMDDLVTYVSPDRSGIEVVTQAADFLYLSSTPGRDRVEGDPFRILTAMAHGIPVIASRSPLVEEFCGKHRIDFCASSPASIAEALQKALCASALKNNVVKKNLSTVEQSYSQEVAQVSFTNFVNQISGVLVNSDQLSIEDQIVQVENYVSNKQYLNAIEMIESVFANQNLSAHQSSNLYRLIGDCFAKLGDNESAKGAYTKALSQDEYSAKAYIGLGTVSLVRETYDSAVFNFQKAIGLSPKDEMANLGLGLAFQGLREFKEAMKWVEKSLELSPDNKSALYTAVQIGHDMGDYTQTSKVLENYLGIHPTDLNFGYTLAGIYFSQGDQAKAAKITDSILAVDPQHQLANELRNQIGAAKLAESGTKS